MMPQVADARADKAEESEKLNRALGDMERMTSEHDQALRRAKDSQRKQQFRVERGDGGGAIASASLHGDVEG